VGSTSLNATFVGTQCAGRGGQRAMVDTIGNNIYMNAVIDARKDLADVLNRAAYGKERVVLTRRGKDVAAIVPMDDLNILEAIEDHMDVTESEKILERVRRGSEQLLTLEEVKAKYQDQRPSRKTTKARRGRS